MRIDVVDRAGLRPYERSLRALERSIEYPIADGADAFTIDHGEDYTAFFAGLGEPSFIIAVDGDEVVGILAAIQRRARGEDRDVPTIYGADLKLAPRARGTGLARRMSWRGFLFGMRPSVLARWRVAYVAAMRGSRGDVMRSARGLHAARLARRGATLAIYFVEPERLARLRDDRAPPPPPTGGLDLSPGPVETTFTSTAGRKDLRLRSTGEPWPLQHLPLGPAAWQPTLGAYLRRAGEAVAAAGHPGPCCFALDERLADQIAWLRAEGVTPGAACTVYSFGLPGAPAPSPWVHLATSEI